MGKNITHVYVPARMTALWRLGSDREYVDEKSVWMELQWLIQLGPVSLRHDPSLGRLESACDKTGSMG